MLYWTAEESKADALMQFAFNRDLVDAAAKAFDAVVKKIRAREFSLTAPPEAGICRECDISSLCRADGVLPRPP